MASSLKPLFDLACLIITFVFILTRISSITCHKLTVSCLLHLFTYFYNLLGMPRSWSMDMGYYLPTSSSTGDTKLGQLPPCRNRPNFPIPLYTNESQRSSFHLCFLIILFPHPLSFGNMAIQPENCIDIIHKVWINKLMFMGLKQGVLMSDIAAKGKKKNNKTQLLLEHGSLQPSPSQEVIPKLLLSYSFFPLFIMIQLLCISPTIYQN